MLTISQKAKGTLESNIGLTLDEIRDLDVANEISYVKDKTGKPVVFSKAYDYRKLGRGNALLARKNVTTIDEVDVKISLLKE